MRGALQWWFDVRHACFIGIFHSTHAHRGIWLSVNECDTHVGTSNGSSSCANRAMHNICVEIISRMMFEELPVMLMLSCQHSIRDDDA